MIHWMFFSTLATGLFYVLYCLTLRRDRWLQLSRAYLIIMLAFGLAFPLLRLPQAVAPVELHVAVLEEVSVTGTVDVTPSPVFDQPSRREGTWLLPAVYAVGVAVTLTLLLLSLVRVYVRTRRMPYERRGGLKITMLDDETEPFSFFGHIVIGRRAVSEEELRLVLAHEGEHVRQRHSVDVLVVRLMCCVAWFNPFVWLMLRELRAVHECQADTAALGENRRPTFRPYMGLLYRQAIGTGYGHITNNFHSINLKKRITMMKRTKSRFGAWKVLAALPVAALLMTVGCKPAENQESNATSAQQQEVVDNGNDTLYDGMDKCPEVEPMFPGGEEALYKYLAENIKYPEQAKKEKIQGKVYINFVIEKDGSIAEAMVKRGIGGGCDEEALRVVNTMPKWTPGKVRGENVRVNYYLPIHFKLQ